MEVVQRRLRNVQKMRDACAKLLFCLSKPEAYMLLSKPIAFLPFSSLRRHRRCCQLKILRPW